MRFAKSRGYAVTPAKLLVVSTIRRRQDGRPMRVYVVRLFVRCELSADDPAAIQGAETTEAAFFGEDALPELSTGRGTLDRLCRVFVHLRDPQRAWDFD